MAHSQKPGDELRFNLSHLQYRMTSSRQQRGCGNSSKRPRPRSAVQATGSTLMTTSANGCRTERIWWVLQKDRCQFGGWGTAAEGGTKHTTIATVGTCTNRKTGNVENIIAEVSPLPPQLYSPSTSRWSLIVITTSGYHLTWERGDPA